MISKKGQQKEDTC